MTPSYLGRAVIYLGRHYHPYQPKRQRLAQRILQVSTTVRPIHSSRCSPRRTNTITSCCHYNSRYSSSRRISLLVRCLDKQQQQQRVCSSSSKDQDESNSSSSSPTHHHDPYDRFRQHAITDEVWQEIQTENEHTRRRAIDVELYDQVLAEMVQAAERIPPPPPELGPTGAFAYWFQDGIYRRQRVADSTCSSSSSHVQTVVDVSIDKMEERTNLLAMSLSVDESLVAYLLETTTTTSNTQQQHQSLPQQAVMIRHIDSGIETELVLPTNGCDISSLELGPAQDAADGSHSLFYVTNDAAQGRPFAVWACTLQLLRDDDVNNTNNNNNNNNTDSSNKNAGRSIIAVTNKPVLLKEFLDPTIMVNVQRTKGCQYVAIQASMKTGNEIYLCRDVDDALQLVMPRQDGVVYHLDVGDKDDVYLLISCDNDSIAVAGDQEQQGMDSNIVEGSLSSLLGLEYSLWKTTTGSLPLRPTKSNSGDCGTFLSGPQDGHVITDMDIFKDFIALYERSTEDGTQRLRLLRNETTSHGGDAQKVTEDDTIVPIFSATEQKCASLSASGNMHYSADSIRFVVESPACPPRVYEYAVFSEQLKLVSGEHAVCHGSVRQERVMVESKDGTKCPMSIVYREQSPSKNDKTKRAVLFGYGSYGEPLALSFDPSLQPLLDRGFVLAYAHTRGGGDLGRAWYHRGRLYEKHKAIEDYIACAHALSSTHQITAKAFSAGGVIVGAAVNQHPELFANVVLSNCFLDVKKTMKNPKLFLTEHEYDEFGDPTSDPKADEAISAYCPVSNARHAQEQTSRFLMIGAFDDTQTPFWNAVVYGKMIRERSRAKNRVFIHIESHGGHHLQLHVAALEAAFIIGNRAVYFGMTFDD